MPRRRQGDVPAGLGWLARDLDRHDSDKAINGVPSVDSHGLVVIDVNAGVLEQPRDVVDRGLISISAKRRLARIRARVCEIGRGNDVRLCCGVADQPIAPKIVAITPCQQSDPRENLNTDPLRITLC